MYHLPSFEVLVQNTLSENSASKISNMALMTVTKANLKVAFSTQMRDLLLKLRPCMLGFNWKVQGTTLMHKVST